MARSRTREAVAAAVVVAAGALGAKEVASRVHGDAPLEPIAQKSDQDAKKEPSSPPGLEYHPLTGPIPKVVRPETSREFPEIMADTSISRMQRLGEIGWQLKNSLPKYEEYFPPGMDIFDQNARVQHRKTNKESEDALRIVQAMYDFIRRTKSDKERRQLVAEFERYLWWAQGENRPKLVKILKRRINRLRNKHLSED